MTHPREARTTRPAQSAALAKGLHVGRNGASSSERHRYDVPQLADPQRAARQFLALVTDDALAQSGFGNRVLTIDEYDSGVRDGFDTFLAAFGQVSAQASAR